MPKPLHKRTESSQETPKIIEVKAPRTKGRRQFSAAEKLRIVRAAEACAHGDLGVLLRREGIYHTQLSDWRAAIDQGLTSRKPGPSKKLGAKDVEIATLKIKVDKLRKELDVVNGLVELQKKVYALLGQSTDARP